MSRNHYVELQPVIYRFFTGLGIAVVVEPRGSRGPDLEGVDGCMMVGEIKRQSEVIRDLRGYWGQWNSNVRFGGKTSEYKVRSEFPPDIDALDLTTRGWIAVIYGQLRNYCRVAQLPAGWLVIEDVERSKISLREAIDYLAKNGKVTLGLWEELEGIGFLQFNIQ